MCLIRIKALKYLSICLSVLWSFRPSIHSFDCPRIHRSDRPSICLPSIRLSICMWSVSLGVYVCFSVCMSSYLSDCPLCLPVCVVCLYICLFASPSALLYWYVRLSFCSSVRLSFRSSVLRLPVRLFTCKYVPLHASKPISLSACPSLRQSVSLCSPSCLSVCMSVCLSVNLSVCLFVFVNLPVCQCVCVCIYVNVSISVCLSVCIFYI